MDYNNWNVDSYHINVAIGDSAIHLLQNVNTHQVESAVLIDGGTAMEKHKDPRFPESLRAINPVRMTIERIDQENIYKFPSNYLQFDTIVLTHWDEDHYGGLVDLLRSDSRDPSVFQNRIYRYLKYGRDQQGNTVPITVMYAPNLEGGINAKGEPNKDYNGMHRVWFAYDPATHFVSINLSDNPKDNPQFHPFAVFKHAGDENATGVNYGSTYSVLGTNFFNNISLQKEPEIMLPRELLQANPPWGARTADGRPGMYCVSVQQKVFPYPKLPVIVKERITKTNRVSIAAVIMWGDGKSRPQVSHYFAGDLDETNEANLFYWLLRGEVFRIPSMKLSHHGARSSTPFLYYNNKNRTVFDVLRPANIIISNPNGSYFHPGWETVYAAYFAARLADQDKFGPRIFALKCPFYFIQNGNGVYLVTIRKDGQLPRYWLYKTTTFEKHKEKQMQPFLQYSEQVYEAFKLVKGHPPEPTELTQYYQYPDKVGRENLVLDLAWAYWQQCAFPQEDKIPSSSTTSTQPFLSTINTNRFILCLRLRSRHDDMDTSNNILKSALEYLTWESRFAYRPQRPNLRSATTTTTSSSSSFVNGNQFGVTMPTPVVKTAPVIVVKTDEATYDPGTNPDEAGDDYSNPDQPDDGNSVTSLMMTTPQPAVKPFRSFSRRIEPVIAASAASGGRGLVEPSDPSNQPSWYFYSTELADQTIKSFTESYTRLVGDPNLDALVSALHYKVIQVYVPSTLPTTGQANLYALQETDEWASWMKDTIKAQDMSIVVLSQSTPTFTGVQFGLAIETSTLSGGDPPVLIFSTAKDVLDNTFSPATPPAMGLLSTPNAIMFGLDVDHSTTGQITLADIVNLMELDDLLNPKSSVLIALGHLLFKLPSTWDKATGRRNAVWFEPESAYRTSIRLQLDLDTTGFQIIKNYVSFLKDIDITQAFIIARKTSTWTSGATQINVQSKGKLALSLSFSIKDFPFTTIFELEPSLMRATLVLDTDKADAVKALTAMLSWLAEQFHLGDADSFFDFTKYSGQSAQSTSVRKFLLRRITVELVPDDETKTAQLASFSVDMELELSFKDKDPILCLVTYRCTPSAGSSFVKSSTLEADLWCSPTFDPNDNALRILPDFENYALFEPKSIPPGKKWPAFLDLAAIGGFDNVPNFIPHLVTQARLIIGAQGIAFTGVIRSQQDTGAQVPILEIDEIDLGVAYVWGTPNDNGVIASLAISCLLQPPPNLKTTYSSPAQLSGAVLYDRGNWTLTASVENLYASSLCQFFDSDIQAAIMPLIESIDVDKMDVVYTYDKKGSASTFDISASLLIGSITFTLNFHHEAKSWKFDAEADFDPKSPTTAASTTLGHVLSSVMGSVEMPSFISDITIQQKTTKDRLGLHMLPVKSEDDTISSLFFTVYFEIDGFRIQLIQFKESSENGKLQRVFLISLDTIDSVTVPLVGDITQPFDEALLMWVQPQKGSDGLSKADVDMINKQLQGDPLNQKPLMWRPVKKDTKDTDVVILSGAHLMLILKDDRGTPTVALDYAFDEKKKADNTAPSSLMLTEPATEKPVGDSEPTTGDTGPAMVAYEKSFGPLAVKNIGFDYSSTDDGKSTIAIKVDALVTLGPIAFELLGFSLGLEFSDGFNLQHFPSPTVNLDGMGGSLDNAPLLMAGVFEHAKVDKTEFFEGAVVVSFVPWAFQAAGYYGKTGGDDSFTSAFVYAMLSGPLITLEFAEITGIVGGFGYNTTLTFPNASNVQDFPFLKVPMPVPSPAGSGPLGALNALLIGPWFATQRNSFWAAAGLTVTAFEMLTVNAVVAVEWDPAVKLGVFGIVTGDIPSSVGDSPKYAHIQFGITATVDFGAGVMKVDGQLTPSSYVFHPDCHLTGGFALYNWFNSQDENLRGDWVFTIGGYHQKFHVPAQYPNPPRLAISWQFDDNISIRGEAYFAITPKVCMGGGRLDVSLSVGVLEAWFDAYADFLINYKPFHFIADGGLSVGVKFTLDLWLVTIHISVEIGATLFIEGPPMHGIVHVDFWVFGFDVNFGSNEGIDPALSLPQFIDLVRQADLQKSTSMGASPAFSRVEEVASDDDKHYHVFSVLEGLYPLNDSKSIPSGGKWYVRAATFAFQISCKFAIDSAEINTMLPDSKITDAPEHTDPVDGTKVDIFGRPMANNAGNVTSTLKVYITPVSPPQPLLMAVEEDPPTVPIWKHNTAVCKNLPAALWGPYNPKEDPSYHANSTDLLNSTTEKTRYLMCGVSIGKPEPLVSESDTMPPFNFQKAQVEDVGTHFRFKDFDPNPESFLPLKPDDTLGGKQWGLVSDAWNHPLMGDNAGDLAVQTWVNDVGLSILGWDPKKMAVEDNRQLTGVKPKGLVDDIDNYFLWAPTLSIPQKTPTPKPVSA